MIFVSLLLQLVLLTAFPQGLIGDTTPRNIDVLFNLSCTDALQTTTKCSQGWNAFKAAFAGKDWNASAVLDYDQYFEVFPIPTNIKDRALFWTGSMPLQAALAIQANMASSTTLIPSVIINTMQSKYNVTAWCGNPNGDIDYTSTNCRPYQPNTTTPVYTFFAALSIRLARNSAGTVFFLTENTFRNTSVFATVELPALLVNAAVKKIVIMNVFPNKTCTQAPLSNIQVAVVNSRPSKEYLCVDVPGTVNNSPPSQSLLDALTKVVVSQQSSG